MVVVLSPLNYFSEICVILISNWKKTFVSNVLANSEEDDYKHIIYSAIKENDIETVRDLLESGISMKEPNEDGLTPLEFAVKCRKIKIAKLLLSSYRPPRVNHVRTRDLLPLFVASKIGSLDFLEKWLNSGLTFDVTNSCGDTPLHCATRFFHSERGYSTIKFLLKHAVDPSVSNRDGLTPLHLIVSTNKKKMDINCYLRPIIYRLVKSGADINCQDSLGRTPLHVARLNRDYNCIFDLLRFGADVNVEDYRGMTILDYIYGKLTSRNCFDELTDLRVPMRCEKHLYEPTRMIIYHVIQMKTVKLYVNEKITSRINDLERWFKYIKKAMPTFSKKYNFYELSTDDVDVFTQKCEEEKKALASTKLGSHTSMINVISMSDQEIARIANKQVLREYFYTGQFRKEFPMYWYFLESRYSAGVARNIILPFARDAMKSFCSHLPEVCLDHILDQFDNNELLRFVRIFFPTIMRGCESAVQISSLLMENKFNLGPLFV